MFFFFYFMTALFEAFLSATPVDRARPGKLVFKVIASKVSNYLVVETSNE